ncbi:hypothetical protein HFP89_04080 [Wenzhouxiangella sp. XN79A]|uniref:hypothetical protein n=1 Tax=Wenzhouxiangella sp. XN79A TaxID=2724193 RepID=UPI00144ACC08|nr:hypothetical protein [Wenzhouxiangella sp. XN79A]NKI34337.1 hypothetical protein [Wenzhouxiangella sp. XN79A]
MRLLPLALLSTALLLTGCGDDKAPDATADSAADRTPEQAAGESGPTFFDRIDADTPYLFANLQRTPESLVDAMWAINDASADSNQAMLDAVAEDEELPPEARALVNEMSSMLTREGWEAAGLHTNPMFAIHGVSLFPVAHVELADTDAFRAKLDRIEAGLERPLSRRQIEGREVIWFGLEATLGIAVLIEDGVVTAGLVPDQPAVLSRLVGATDPVDAMAPGALRALNREIGLTPYGSGYLDFERVIARVLGPDPVIGALDVDGELDAFRNDPACPAEFQALATAMPRMVMGYSEMTETRADALLRIETSPSIGQALAPIARAPVSIDRELKGLMSFGMAFELLAARDFARGLVDGWVETPPQCEAFATVAEQAPQVQAALNRPIPPVVTNIKGLFLEADSLSFSDEGLPTGGGTLAFFMKNPQLLVGMAQMFSPQVAELQLEPGGEPQKVPVEAIPQLAGTGLEAWMAMSENAIGMAIGAESVDGLTAGLDRTEADPFLMTGRMDFDLLIDLMDVGMKSMQSSGMDVEAETAEMLEAQRAQYERMAEYYDQGAFRIALTEAGIDFVFEARLNADAID